MTVDEEYRWHTAMVIGAIILAVAGSIVYVSTCDDCEAKGGVLVQTATGFACVEKK